ncbi:MAG: efflux RND transporter periplasmic adaptor subunit [Thermoguttaceae bacterium]|jgi:RND family efflux transporter MFP subunit|nr:efflux RND transporter periplasmic adaptor subunit [Thermoguttaceae bacterium]
MKWAPVLKLLLVKVLPAVAGLALLVTIMAYMAGALSTDVRSPGRVEPPGRTLPDGAAVAAVAPVEQPYVEEAIGSLKAESRTEISSRVMAAIKTVSVRSGSNVTQGDELIQLDRRDLEAERSQAEANVVAAQAALNRAENDFKRAEQLFQNRTVSREQYDQTVEATEVARARLKAAQDKLDQADVMLTFTTIAAPKDGVIVERLAEPGDMARPGEPLLLLYSPTTLRLEVPVMENLAVHVKVGDQLRVKIDAIGDQQFEGTVDEIVPQADFASRSFLVKLSLPPSDRLFEGMFGRVFIPAGSRRHLCLKEGAVETVGQLEFVDVVRDDGSLERRFIKSGRRGFGGRVEVLAGLEADEKVWVKRPAEQ